MSQTPPTTAEISANIVAQIEASTNQTVPSFAKSFIRVFAKAFAAVVILVYKYAGFTALQLFVRTASASPTTFNGVTVTPLTEWGRLIGVGDPIAATSAEVVATVTVITQGGVLPAGSAVLNSSTGITYITLAAVALDAATVPVSLRAVADQSGGDGSGSIGNVLPGAVLSFANPLGAVSRNLVVASVTVTAADAESTNNYRQRILDRFQKRPQGGAYSDYEIWGEETAGIVSVYPYTSACPGQVDVYVEATPESSGSPDGIPTNAQLQAVLDSIELDQSGLATRRPAGALVNAFPITRSLFVVDVAGLEVTGLAQVQADVTAALTDYFATREPFILGLSVPPRRDRIAVTAVSAIVDDIVAAAGGVFGGVTVTQSDVPIIVYTLGIGQKAKATVAFS